MTMQCHACGASLTGTEKFCPTCGVELLASSQAGDDVRRSRIDTTKRYARIAAGETLSAGRTAVKSKLGKEVAAGAAIGAVLAIPIPLIGPLTGAVVGTGIVLYKRYWKS